MKKSSLTLLLSMSLALCLTACSASAEIKVDKPTLESSVIEQKESTSTSNESTQPSESSSESQTEEIEATVSIEVLPSTDVQWSNVKEDASTMECEYTDGISDDYILCENCTFRNLSTRLNQYLPDFDTEVLRQVISLYFAKPEWYSEMNNLSYNQQLYEMARLVSLSWTIDHTENKVHRMIVDKSNVNVYNFIFDSPAQTYKQFIWDVSDNTLVIITNDDQALNEVNTFSDESLETLIAIINEAYQGALISGQGEIKSGRVEGTSDAASELAKFSLIGSKANEIVGLIEKYYDSKIISIEDTSFADSESANIYVENGKKCRLYGTADTGVSIYDITDSYETIWYGSN